MTVLRYRTDSIIAAEEARDRARGQPPCDPGWVTDAEVAATPAAVPGDIWRIVYGARAGQPETTAGYAICCPRCGALHFWCSAANCPSKRALAGGGFTCDHQQARISCWTWTGDVAAGTLTAQPSLFCDPAIGGCGWHGFLTNGSLEPC